MGTFEQRARLLENAVADVDASLDYLTTALGAVKRSDVPNLQSAAFADCEDALRDLRGGLLNAHHDAAREANR